MAEEIKVKPSKKPVFIPLSEREPYDEANAHLSKAQFIEKQRQKKERKLELQRIAADLEAKELSKKDRKIK